MTGAIQVPKLCWQIVIPLLLAGWIVTPVSGADPPGTLKVTIQFPMGVVIGTAADCEFSLDGKTYRLSDVQKLSAFDRNRKSSTSVMRYTTTFKPVGRETRSVSGTTLVGLSKFAVRVAHRDLHVDLAQAGVSIIVEPLQTPNVTKYALYQTIADVVAGGGGGWLVLRLPDRRCLVVFDVRRRAFTYSIPLVDDHVLLAAGADRLVAVFPNHHLLQLWRLDGGSLERSASLPWRGETHAALGSSSEGPLFIHWWASGADRESRWSTVDLNSLEVADVTTDMWPIPHPTGSDTAARRVLCSADGRVVTSGNVFKGDQVVTVPRAGGFDMLPGADGRRLYSGNAILDLTGTTMEGARADRLLPTRSPDYFLGLGRPSREWELTIYRTRNNEKVQMLWTFDCQYATGLPIDKRYHWWADERVLITIPPGDDHLLLTPLAR